MAKKSLGVIPEPKNIDWGEAHFSLDAQTWIVLLPSATEADLDAARSLQIEISQATGLQVPIAKTARPPCRDNLILLSSDLGEAAVYLDDPSVSAEPIASQGEQAYLVRIESDRVIAGGQGTLALHYAVQTLRQIARLGHCRWPVVEVTDWPSLAYRGLMLDVSRGKVPTLETLKLVVDQLSLIKMNVLQLYTEHTFHFPHHPRIGEGCGSLSGDDILALDAYARQHHVELMPNLQSFGHCAHILAMPQYAHLAEMPEAGWSLCPQDEDTYRFLDELYGDLLPNFSSRTLNINCDETYDLGKGRSADAVGKVGIGRVYLNHILRLRELAQAHGCRLQLWGDILLHHPELVREVPEDVVLLDWHYGAEDDYPSVRTFAESGRTFWVCPGTSSWNTLFPRIENSNRNIAVLARLGAEHGAQGLLNTDWGDHGHYQPIGQCWYGYAYGAEQAWTGGLTQDAGFDANFGPLFFGDCGDSVVGVMRLIGQLNVLEGMPRRNATNSIYALLDDPLVGQMQDQMPAETLREIVTVCEGADAILRACLSASRDPLSIEEMAYSIRMMAYAARKVLASQEMRTQLAQLEDGGGEPRAVISDAIQCLYDLDAELVELGGLFEEIWLRRARRSEIEITLGHLDGLRSRYAAAIAWLSKRLSALDAGAQPTYDLTEYGRSAEGYEVLGESFRRRMRDAGVFA